MKQFLGYQVKLIFYYLFLFAFMRLLFLTDTRHYFENADAGEILRCFTSALKLDLVTTAYFIIPGLLLILIKFISRKNYLDKILKGYHLTLTMLYAGLSISEIFLYREWQAKIGYDSLKHFVNITEVIKTPSLTMVGGFMLGTGLTFILFRWIYKKWVHTSIQTSGYNRNLPFYLIVIFVYLLSTGLSVIMMRGGLNRFPIGMGAAYYSNKSALNDGATNVLWNAIYSLLHTSEYDRLQPFIDSDPGGINFFSKYRSPQDSFPQVLNTATPNLVFLILESWPADVCQTSGKDDLIAPHFNKMIKEGFYFSNCYAIGHVSDQGVPATLGALPVIPAFSMLTGKQQVGELPCLVDELKSKNYYSGFLYGGQLDYGNIRGYVYKKGFDKVWDVQNFPRGTEKTALGVPDLPLYKQLLVQIKEAREPFLYCGYNISTHSPYDVPVNYKLNVGGVNAPFINTIHYGDSSLNVFFTEAKKQSWYKNTLFVLVADHSHESQIIRVKEDKDRYKIPLLLYGPALNQQYQGYDMKKIISQLDIIGLLYDQLGIPFEKKYPFSRNPLKKNHPEVAFYNYPGGSGVVTRDGNITKDLNVNRKIEGTEEERIKELRLWVDQYLHEAAKYLQSR